jgi:hypothetical protein
MYSKVLQPTVMRLAHYVTALGQPKEQDYRARLRKSLHTNTVIEITAGNTRRPNNSLPATFPRQIPPHPPQFQQIVGRREQRPFGFCTVLSTQHEPIQATIDVLAEHRLDGLTTLCIDVSAPLSPQFPFHAFLHLGRVTYS